MRALFLLAATLVLACASPRRISEGGAPQSVASATEPSGGAASAGAADAKTADAEWPPKCPEGTARDTGDQCVVAVKAGCPDDFEGDGKNACKPQALQTNPWGRRSGAEAILARGQMKEGLRREADGDLAGAITSLANAWHAGHEATA